MKMKLTTNYGRTFDGTIISTQEEVDNIIRRGYFGKMPKIGRIYEYLGPSDGGFAVYDRDEIMELSSQTRKQEDTIELDR